MLFQYVFVHTRARKVIETPYRVVTKDRVYFSLETLIIYSKYKYTTVYPSYTEHRDFFERSVKEVLDSL